jgi:hypothetical protein
MAFDQRWTLCALDVHLIVSARPRSAHRTPHSYCTPSNYPLLLFLTDAHFNRNAQLQVRQDADRLSSLRDRSISAFSWTTGLGRLLAQFPAAAFNHPRGNRGCRSAEKPLRSRDVPACKSEFRRGGTCRGPSATSDLDLEEGRRDGAACLDILCERREDLPACGSRHSVWVRANLVEPDVCSFRNE